MSGPSTPSMQVRLVRLRLRYQLGEAIRDIVLLASDLDEAIEYVAVPEVDLALFKILFRSELQQL